MKTLLIATAIIVTAHGKQIRLSNSEVDYLNAKGTTMIKSTIKSGNKDIRNNEAADQIFKLLKR